MTEPPRFDITQPSPDAGHEAIRVAVVQTTDTLFSLVESLRATLDDLSARVAALESPFVLTDPEESA